MFPLFNLTDGLFDSYISQQLIRARWSSIPECGSQCVGLAQTPDMRGGHQMCIDCDGGQLYLYGGWDGSKELGDLWQFTIKSQQWTSLDTSQEVKLFCLCVVVSAIITKV